MEQVIPFLDQDAIVSLVGYLVKPLSKLKTDGLNIQTTASQRFSRQFATSEELGSNEAYMMN